MIRPQIQPRDRIEVRMSVRDREILRDQVCADPVYAERATLRLAPDATFTVRLPDGVAAT